MNDDQKRAALELAKAFTNNPTRQLLKSNEINCSLTGLVTAREVNAIATLAVAQAATIAELEEASGIRDPLS